MVVFSDGATFKDILTDESVALVYESDLKAEIKSTLKSENCLSSEDINDLYDNLFPYTQVSGAEKQKHIENLSLSKTYHKPNTPHYPLVFFRMFLTSLYAVLMVNNTGNNTCLIDRDD